METTLVDQYLKTDYKIFHPAITIKIGQMCSELDELLEEHDKQTWAFITSSNPYSKILSEELNTERLERLREKLIHYPLYLGAGIGEDPNWKPELSFLVLGIPKEEACRFGLLFEQNAIVVGRQCEIAELIVLE